jgi:hypothetical protein
MTEVLTASIRYVRRDEKHGKDEKGYILHYAAPSGFPQNNFTIESYHGIKVHDLRAAGLSFEDHGMMVASLDSSKMEPKNFDDDEWIEQSYLPELHSCICRAMGARNVTIFDWMVRKRASSFPERNVGEKNEEAPQPSLSAHIGELTTTPVLV